MGDELVPGMKVPMQQIRDAIYQAQAVRIYEAVHSFLATHSDILTPDMIAELHAVEKPSTVVAVDRVLWCPDCKSTPETFTVDSCNFRRCGDCDTPIFSLTRVLLAQEDLIDRPATGGGERG